MIANALSRRESLIMAISIVIVASSSTIETSYTNDDHCKSLERLTVSANAAPPYTPHSGILRYKGKIYVGSDVVLKHQIMDSLCNSPIGGHSSIMATYQRVKKLFYSHQA
jgi:hypothetical protein